MSLRQAQLELLVEDVLADCGFLPGLRPRGHEAVLGDALALLEDDALAAGGDAGERQVEELLHGLMWRRPEAGGELFGDEQAPSQGDGDPAAGDPAASVPPRDSDRPRRGAPREGCPGIGVDAMDVLHLALRDLSGAAAPADPQVRHNRRRLAGALQDVADFEPRNRHQAELRTLLIWLFDHLRRECCAPDRGAAFEHWWQVAKVYARVLACPEMATRKAWEIKTRLLELKAEELTERRLAQILGRRKRRDQAEQEKTWGLLIV